MSALERRLAELEAGMALLYALLLENGTTRAQVERAHRECRLAAPARFDAKLDEIAVLLAAKVRQ